MQRKKIRKLNWLVLEHLSDKDEATMTHTCIEHAGAWCSTHIVTSSCTIYLGISRVGLRKIVRIFFPWKNKMLTEIIENVVVNSIDNSRMEY